MKKTAKPKLKVRTQVKAGGGPHDGVQLNHNEHALKEKKSTPKLKVRTQVKAGGQEGVKLNHNEQLR